MRFADTDGCELSPHCLTCSEPRCKYDLEDPEFAMGRVRAQIQAKRQEERAQMDNLHQGATPVTQGSRGPSMDAIRAAVSMGLAELTKRRGVVAAQMAVLDEQVCRLEAALDMLDNGAPVKKVRGSTKGRKLNLTPEDRAARSERLQAARAAGRAAREPKAAHV